MSLKKNVSLQGYVLKYVHSSSICHSQYLETTYLLLILAHSSLVITNFFFPRHLPSHLPKGRDACHLWDDSSQDSFPATPLAKGGYLALPFPTGALYPQGQI